jgi:hypothetical protein
MTLNQRVLSVLNIRGFIMSKSVTIKIDDAVHAALVKLAKQGFRSMASQIKMILDDWYKTTK